MSKYRMGEKDKEHYCSMAQMRKAWGLRPLKSEKKAVTKNKKDVS